MITNVSVRNFQSLRAVDVELGRFTVIVGSSSSGKSAFIRAMRALVSNARGSDYVSRGSKSALVTARLGDDTTVSLERGEGIGKYQLRVGEGTETFTKLAAAVPEQITRALQIQPVKDGQSINFAGQFDRPYLLTESGAEVARQLGDLTNVITILEAAREANRRRGGQAATLKIRRTDLEGLKARLPEFHDMPAKLAACSAAEKAVGRGEALALRVTRLRDLIAQQGVAGGVLERAAQALPRVPAIDPVVAAHNRLGRFRQLLGQWSGHLAAVRKATESASSWAVREQEARDGLHATLREAGQCPTCNQKIPV